MGHYASEIVPKDMLSSIDVKTASFNALPNPEAIVKFEPLGNRIVVQMEGAETMSKGGLFIPESATERPQIAKVLAVGDGEPRPDGTTIPQRIRVGDRIVLGKYAGMSLTIEGQSFVVLDGREVLGILR